MRLGIPCLVLGAMLVACRTFSLQAEAPVSALEAARERQLLDLVAAGRDGLGRAIEWLTGRIDEELQRVLVS